MNVMCDECGFMFPYGLGDKGESVPHTNVWGKMCPVCHAFIPPLCEPPIIREGKERKRVLVDAVIRSIREKYFKYQQEHLNDLKRRSQGEH